MAKRRRMKKSAKRTIYFLVIIGLTLPLSVLVEYEIRLHIEQTPKNEEKEVYSIRDFGYVVINSETDYNKNGIPDNVDIIAGAKVIVEINPKYVSKYYAGGYPPETEGVCTDVIWRALQEAGYNLKEMMSRDIRDRHKEKVYNIPIIDDNIDFRRVGNQEVFFKEYALSLSTDLDDLGEFQPGDIVTFDDSDHIAIISDKVNERGIPYLIQNSDEEQTEKEEDVLEETPMQITGHYRFVYTDKIQELINRI